jgi:hypothetical protein
MHRITALIMVCVLGLALSLAGCAGTSPGTSTGSGPTLSATDTLAKLQAGASYLDATLDKLKTAVATAKTQAPDKAAAIEARVEPALTTLASLVGTFDTAVAAKDTTGASSAWTVARDAVTAAVDAGITVLGPKVLAALLGA